MLVLRCTRKLLDRLRIEPATTDGPSTTVLGDWYATILPVRPAHLVLLVNERSRLPVVLSARELSTLLDRIPEAIADVLSELGADASIIARERDAMGEIRCATTRSRSVLGTMNEFVFEMQIRREHGALTDLHALSLSLANVLVTIGCPATIFVTRPAHLVLLVNERSRLPVVLPARELLTLLDRIPDAVAEARANLGVPASAIERERAAMQMIQCAPTRNRSVLGAMNESAFQIQWWREGGDLPDLRTLNRDLSQLLIGVGGRDYLQPADEVRRLLG